MATSVGFKRKMTPEERQKAKEWARKHKKIIVFKDGEVFDGRTAEEGAGKDVQGP